MVEDELARRKSPVDSSDDECNVELADDRSLAEEARAPVAISIATGASTAVILCHEEGALAKSSTSPACCLSLALCLFSVTLVVVVDVGDDADGVAVVVVVELLSVGVEVVEVVVVVVVEEEDACGFADFMPLVALDDWLVSLALLWPKLAASLPLISATAPFSAEADLTVTNLTRAKLLAVGVDLITRLRMRCCSPEATSVKANATVKQMISFIFANTLCLSCVLSI